MTNYSIHPSIGIARLGNSKEAFYLAPETIGVAPRQCDPQGNPEIDKENCQVRVTKYKDKKGAIKRQAAQFQIIVTDENGDERSLKEGDMIQGNGSKGKLQDIEWTVYPANKKAAWYQFQQLEGEHGYAADAPLRNSDITDTDLRQQLIIDPGPQTISSASKDTAGFGKGENYGYAQSFPEHLEPNNIDTLGEIRTNHSWDLIFLGGYGNSGSYKKGFGNPIITQYANNDGWFDDTSDGPVSAKLKYYDECDQQERYLTVEPAWVITGYPGYAPEIIDMITMDDLVYDLMLRDFAYDTYIYGTGNFTDDSKREQPQTPEELAHWRLSSDLQWNLDYYPNFCKDIFPILLRPYYMNYVTSLLDTSVVS